MAGKGKGKKNGKEPKNIFKNMEEDKLNLKNKRSNKRGQSKA